MEEPALQSQTAALSEVGAMRYDVVIVPDMRTIRASTLDRLERHLYRVHGEYVIFYNQRRSHQGLG